VTLPPVPEPEPFAFKVRIPPPVMATLFGLLILIVPPAPRAVGTTVITFVGTVIVPVAESSVRLLILEVPAPKVRLFSALIITAPALLVIAPVVMLPRPPNVLMKVLLPTPFTKVTPPGFANDGVPVSTSTLPVPTDEVDVPWLIEPKVIADPAVPVAKATRLPLLVVPLAAAPAKLIEPVNGRRIVPLLINVTLPPAPAVEEALIEVRATLPPVPSRMILPGAAPSPVPEMTRLLRPAVELLPAISVKPPELPEPVRSNVAVVAVALVAVMFPPATTTRLEPFVFRVPAVPLTVSSPPRSTLPDADS
jgi:hypothetical protein